MGGRRHRKQKGKKTMKGGMYGATEPIAVGAMGWKPVTNIGATSASGLSATDINGGQSLTGGRRRGTRRRGMTAKAMKRVLKKNGLKVSGKKSTLTKRMKKAKLMKGGAGQYLPDTANSGFTAKGAVGGLGGYEDVSGGAPRLNNVAALPA